MAISGCQYKRRDESSKLNMELIIILYKKGYSEITFLKVIEYKCRCREVNFYCEES